VVFAAGTERAQKSKTALCAFDRLISMMNDDGLISSRRRPGRPKGSKDRVKRARRQSAAGFAFTLDREDLAEIAASGRALDLIGILRYAQVAIAVRIIEGIETRDNQRLAALCGAAKTLHRMEMEARKNEAEAELRKSAQAPDPQAASRGDDSRGVISLPDFRPRREP
jgi:hypothetical protein